MNKNIEKNEEENGQQLTAIEQLAEEQRTPAHILSAVCAGNGWGAGKAVTAAEYKKEVESFLRSPIGRRN